MIRPSTPDDLPGMYDVINDAAKAYKGVIADDCWHDPYMSMDELLDGIENGIQFWVCTEGEELVGLMGIQHVQDVTLIRHAYVRPLSQRRGVGSKLLSHLITLTERPILIGTWAAAKWAIQFYEKHGFRLAPRAEIAQLLGKYWSISPRQTETSVVLCDRAWYERPK
jgi:GNAT superfamily N-acetyltransferase